MMSDIYEFFNTESVTAIVNRPTGGSMFHYSWADDVKKDDWKVDGYRWRLCGSAKDKKCGSGLCDRKYFQIYDGPNSWNKCFTKIAYFRRVQQQYLLLKNIKARNTKRLIGSSVIHVHGGITMSV